MLTEGVDKCFNLTEAAALLGVSRTTAYREVRDGRLGYYVFRGQRRYGASHISEYQAARERRAKK
jgi:excisionase family DNA binding protein